GERRRDQPRESHASLLETPYLGARGRLQDREGLRGPLVLPAARRPGRAALRLPSRRHDGRRYRNRERVFRRPRLRGGIQGGASALVIEAVGRSSCAARSGLPAVSAAVRSGSIAWNGASASTPSDSITFVQNARAAAVAAMSKISASVNPMCFSRSTS